MTRRGGQERRRRARELRALKRAGPRRSPYDVVLIVCEGAKTEPYYFDEMRAVLRLASANIVVTGEGGTDPMSVVDTAIERFREDPTYDRVYCVFDQDTHANFGQALNRLKATTLRQGDGRSGPVVPFQAIPSVPCFEYWLLLHYVYTTRPYKGVGGRSACDCVIHELKHNGHLPNYTKGAKGLFRQTAPRLDDAVRNAERALRAAESAGTDNPTTRVHELVQYLRDLAQQRP